MEIAQQREVYSVGRLNREARLMLEAGLPALWVEGEMSNFSSPASGHWYFTLKDRDAQIRCAMFRTRNTITGFCPRDGQQVLLRGRVSLYEPRGDYQLIAERMEDAGEGALRREFERLKAKLAAEGLFDPAIKRPLPIDAPAHCRGHLALGSRDPRCGAYPRATLSAGGGAHLPDARAGRGGNRVDCRGH